MIPTWHNFSYLKLAVESVRKNSTYDHQIIVIVNGDYDETLEWVKAQDDIDIVLFRENAGVCYALNAARTLVNSEWILFINDDMYVLPEWDKELLDEAERIGDIWISLSSTVIEPFQSPNTCVIVGDYGRGAEDFQENKLLTEFRDLEREDWSGSNYPPVLTHVKVWDYVGGYSIEFSPGAASDRDFSRKLWEAGVRIFKGVSASRVYHFVSKSVGRIKMNDGRKGFIFKWGTSSRTFINHNLNIGKSWKGPLQEHRLSARQRIINNLKRKLL